MLENNQNYTSGLIIICTVWSIGILALACAHVYSANTGFLWPMGQDIDWSIILKQGIGARAANQEFMMDHRNPLSAWFYTIVSPLILNYKFGFHFLHLLTSLILGISVYTLIRQFCLNRAPFFSVTTGTIIAIWWFWSNYTQVIALMLFALSLSILAVWSYCVYIDSNRKAGTFYGLSLSFWLIALGTYTIQCGAIIPIFTLGLLRGKSRGVLRAIKDILPYLLIGLAFAGIWITAAAGFFNEPVVKETVLINVRWTQLIRSIAYFLWHPSFSIYFKKAFFDWSFWTLIFPSICFIIIMFWLMRILTKEEDYKKTYLLQGTLWTLITALGLAVPTILLEATSQTWAPGLRSDMMFAAFIPMLYLSIAVLSVSWIGTSKWINYTLFFFASCLGSAVIILNISQNQEGVAVMQWQRNLIKGLLPLQKKYAENLHFIVINDNGEARIGYSYANRLLADKMNRYGWHWTSESAPELISMRIIESKPAPADYLGSWRVVFGPQTVTGALPASSVALPYTFVRIVRFDGKKVTPLKQLTAHDLVGLQADFARDTPLLLTY